MYFICSHSLDCHRYVLAPLRLPWRRESERVRSPHRMSVNPVSPPPWKPDWTSPPHPVETTGCRTSKLFSWPQPLISHWSLLHPICSYLTTHPLTHHVYLLAWLSAGPLLFPILNIEHLFAASAWICALRPQHCSLHMHVEVGIVPLLLFMAMHSMISLRYRWVELNQEPAETNLPE